MVSAKKAKFEGTIQPWGNSLGLRIIRPMDELANLTKGSKVVIEITAQGMLVIRFILFELGLGRRRRYGSSVYPG